MEKIITDPRFGVAAGWLASMLLATQEFMRGHIFLPALFMWGTVAGLIYIQNK